MSYAQKVDAWPMWPESYGVTPHTYSRSSFRPRSARGSTRTFRLVSVSWTRSARLVSGTGGPTTATRLIDRARENRRVGAQRIDPVHVLPRHAQVVATEVAVGSGRPVDRP